MNIIVDNLLVRYTRQGSGKPIVMLHGWGDRLETYDALTVHLESEYEVIRIDLAGFGSSQPPDTAWGLDEYVQQVESFLLKLNVTPYALVGHSNGGAVVIKGLAAKRLTATKFVLIASAGVRNTQKLRKAAWLTVAKVGKLATVALPSDARSKLRSRLYSSAGSDILVSPHMEATFKRIVSEDVLAPARTISLPALIINGTADTATPPTYAKLFNEAISGSQLELIQGADHFVHQQHSDDVAKIMREFLS